MRPNKCLQYYLIDGHGIEQWLTSITHEGAKFWIIGNCGCGLMSNKNIWAIETHTLVSIVSLRRYMNNSDS